MSTTNTQPRVGIEELTDALSEPEAYPDAPDEVQVLQTHISKLFFAGDRVYKLKKPVRLPFLDYSSLRDRKHFCEEEVRLNRRIAPRTYLGVRPVTRERGGAIAIDGEGTVVDWVVEMERLPEDRMLDVLLERGDVGEPELERVAAVLARFHRRAKTGPSVNRFGLARNVAAEAVTNLDQLVDAAGGRSGPLSALVLDFLRERAAAFPREERDLVERRMAEWRIREGHGDLHAGNVCLLEDEVIVYDCVEFDRQLRCCDVASDIAFLAMDMDHRGCADASRFLLRRYAELAEDPELPAIAPYYQTYRALVRAKVELLTARDEASDTAAHVREARHYLHLAAGYQLPPFLVLTCGLPATGKSHAASYVATRLRARLLSTDDLRRERGLDAVDGDVYGQGRYDRSHREDVYRAMLERTTEALADGRSVVADATFSRRAFRRPFLDAAARLGVPCYVLRFDVPVSVARGRLERRAEDPEAASDAGFDVYLGEAQHFEAPAEVPRERVVECSGTAAPEVHAEALLERAIARPADSP